MGVEPDWVLVLGFELNRAFGLLPVYRHTAPYAHVGEGVVPDSVDFFSLYEVSDRLSVRVGYSPVEQFGPAEYFGPASDEEIVAVVGELFILDEALHEGNAPTFMGVVLFEDPNKVLVPEESGLGVFVVQLDVFEGQCDV